jgi:hypothetical protein
MLFYLSNYTVVHREEMDILNHERSVLYSVYYTHLFMDAPHDLQFLNSIDYCPVSSQCYKI